MDNYLIYDDDVTRHRGEAISSGKFIYKDYIVYYWYAGQGIILYSFYRIPEMKRKSLETEKVPILVPVCEPVAESGTVPCADGTSFYELDNRYCKCFTYGLGGLVVLGIALAFARECGGGGGLFDLAYA